MTTTAQQILVATDFSETADAALDVAIRQAQTLGARLHLLHVYSASEVEVTRLLTDAAARARPDVPVTVAGTRGDPAREILRYATRHPIDLIVLGTHGRTGMSRMILGSVAEGVVRLAPCLVLTVPPTVLEAERTAQAARAAAAAVHRCLVCGRDIESDELICESCRTKIRAETLGQKIQAERPGRRGSSA